MAFKRSGVQFPSPPLKEQATFAVACFILQAAEVRGIDGRWTGEALVSERQSRQGAQEARRSPAPRLFLSRHEVGTEKAIPLTSTKRTATAEAVAVLFCRRAR